VLFFIGAPLGAIIKKGGLGLPIVISTIIFIFYHILSISAEKTVKEGQGNPFWGMWLATLIFLPIGIFLTFKATTDSALFDIEAYTKFFKRKK
jgi:lipopolysaccharide export system permease protein